MKETFVAEVSIQRYDKFGAKIGIRGVRLGFGNTEQDAVKDLEKEILKGEKKLSEVVIYRSHPYDKRVHEGERPAQVAEGTAQDEGQAKVGEPAVDRSSYGRNFWAT